MHTGKTTKAAPTDAADATDAARSNNRPDPATRHDTIADDSGQAQQHHISASDGHGTHLLMDLHGADRLDNPDHMERAMREAITASGATLLHLHLHRFTPNDTSKSGITGVAVLAESHITVHTWPEHGYAAFDVFMCGNTDPNRAAEVLQQAFQPKRAEIIEHRRGMPNRDCKSHQQE